MNKMGVIAAKTNWKYASEPSGNLKFGIRPFSSGMLACACSPAAPTIVDGLPTNVEIHGEPKPILNAQSTQTISVRQNALNTIIMVLTAHLRCTIPPYKTARAGMLIKPTSVAAVSCQALSPELSQLA